MIKYNYKKNIGSVRTFTRIFSKGGCFRGGFTLLEALVAVSILMVAVVAPITIAQKGLSSAVYTKNQMIASYLAQDAIEYIKNVRDGNILLNKITPTVWLDGFDDCLDSNLCAVDTKYDSIGEIFEDETKVLKKEKDIEGKFQFYGYFTGEDTNFTRSINIKKISDDEALINVVVRWDADIDNKVDVSTLIYNY